MTVVLLEKILYVEGPVSLRLYAYETLFMLMETLANPDEAITRLVLRFWTNYFEAVILTQFFFQLSQFGCISNPWS